MARRRFVSARDMQVQKERVNDMIRISPVRVIGPENEQYGVIELTEAKRLAQESGLDLVEVSPQSRPPVCRIMDYGKYKYQQSKKQRKQKSGSAKSELKEIRLGRSMRIDPHDVEMRVNQAREFLLDGHKVQFIQPFQGREMQHKDLGFERMKGIAETLDDVGRVELTPKFNGRRLIMTMAPDRAKIKALKQNDRKGNDESAQSASRGDSGADDEADDQHELENEEAVEAVSREA